MDRAKLGGTAKLDDSELKIQIHVEGVKSDKKSITLTLCTAFTLYTLLKTKLKAYGLLNGMDS